MGDERHRPHADHELGGHVLPPQMRGERERHLHARDAKGRPDRRAQQALDRARRVVAARRRAAGVEPIERRERVKAAHLERCRAAHDAPERQPFEAGGIALAEHPAAPDAGIECVEAPAAVIGDAASRGRRRFGDEDSVGDQRFQCARRVDRLEIQIMIGEIPRARCVIKKIARPSYIERDDRLIEYRDMTMAGWHHGYLVRWGKMPHPLQERLIN